MPKDNRAKGSFDELLTQQVNQSKKRIINSMTEPHTFTWQQVEIAERWARNKPYSRIREDLDIKYDSQISASLKKFESTAEVMREAIKKLSHVGYWEKRLKNSGNVKVLVARAREAEEQMLCEGRWPFPCFWGYKLVENRRLELDQAKKSTLSQFIQRCAEGEVPYAVAKELHIPVHAAYSFLIILLLKVTL